MTQRAPIRLDPPAIHEILLCLRGAISLFSDRNVLELLGVLEGVKDVVRVPVTSAEWQLLREGCQQLGLAVGHANFKLAVLRTTRVGDTFTTNVPWDDPRGREFPAYVARSRDTVRRAIEVETAAETDHSMGRLYQYPDCCIDAYAEIARGLPWVEALVRRAEGSRQDRAANKLAYLFDGGSLFPDDFPCSLSCAATAALSRMYRSLLAEYGLGDLAESLWARMGCPVLVGRGVAYQFAAWRLGPRGLGFATEGVRRCTWTEDEPDPLGSCEFLDVREDGPWLRASADGEPYGTLFLFGEPHAGNPESAGTAKPAGTWPAAGDTDYRIVRSP